VTKKGVTSFFGRRRGGVFGTFAIFALFLLSAAPIRAADSLLGWLLYATNDGTPSTIPPGLAKYDRKLPKALGYSHLRVLADGRTATDSQGHRFLIFTSDLKILLKDLSHDKDDDYLVGLQLFQGGQSLLETQVKVSRGSPIFIRGPEWRDGQLIVAVMVKS
jgi:hypothetical protein